MNSPRLNATLELIRDLSDDNLVRQVEEHWASRTKPRHSLGKLESLLLHFSLIQGVPIPRLERKAMFVFCADHGVTQEGVSAFPSEVTAQMVANFLKGGAAINVLCRQFGIEPVIVDMGVRGEAQPGAVNLKIAEGTCNFAKGPAMSREQAIEALETGIELAGEAARQYDVAGIGEMGIGNTTSAAAIFSACSGLDPEETAGPGTGLDPAGLAHKRMVIRAALQLHRSATDPISILAAFGGFEIGAMAGFLLGAAAMRLPVVVDGFIASSAALIAKSLAPAALDAAIFSHCSAEPGHAAMLDFLGVSPYLNLGLRLGEGTGAALCINLLESSVRLYREMATFDSAAVSRESH
jgi:nicotinate-nucleotide--dimethylbenzimidazole phosphoribosyltransferase